MGKKAVKDIEMIEAKRKLHYKPSLHHRPSLIPLGLDPKKSEAFPTHCEIFGISYSAQD